MTITVLRAKNDAGDYEMMKFVRYGDIGTTTA